MSAVPTASPRRLLFLIDPENGHVTVHLRGLMFADHFKNAGWHVEFINVREIPFDQIVTRAKEFPAVYLLKVCFYRLIRELKAGAPNTKIIFDLTDALWQPFHRACGWHNLEKILAASDAIFSENEFICSYGRQFTRHVYSIPACTQVEKVDAARATLPARTNTQIRLGWMGSPGTATAINSIAPQLHALFAAHKNLHLRLLGCTADHVPALANLPPDSLSFLPIYNEEIMIRELLHFDIGLFPPPGDAEDYAIRGALKGMLYMTAGIPAVCLNAGDCARIMQDRITAMLINTPEEWTTKTAELITNPTLRQYIGTAAAIAIRKDHTINAVFAILEKSLLDVYANVPLKPVVESNPTPAESPPPPR